MTNKILFITPHYLPIMGGIEQNIYKVSSYLKEDFTIDILTTELPHASSFENIEGISVYRRKNMDFFSHDYIQYDTILIENFSIFPHFLSLLKIAYLKSIRRFKIKIILIPHGGFTTRGPQFNKLQKIVKTIYNHTFGLLLINTCVDEVIAVSTWEAEGLYKAGIGKPITTIRNGIDLISFPPTQKENYIVFVGRIDPIKNIEEIITTYAFIVNHPEFDSYQLKIMGNYRANPAYYKLLQKLIAKLNLDRKVEFLGEYRDIRKSAVIAKACCLFCLSLEESDSIVIKEAFALKTKVFINTNGALKDYQNENNVFVKIKDAFDISDFKKFLNKPFDEQLLLPLYTWEKVSELYKNIALS